MMFWRALKLATIASLAFLQARAQSGIDDVLLALAKMHDCPTCRDVLVQLQNIAERGDDEFIDIFSETCILLQLEDPDVCTGMISLSGPIIAHDLRQINVTSGRAGAGLCDALFGFCSTNVSTPFQVPLPPPSGQVNDLKRADSRQQPRRAPFQVVHISDVHIDRQYTVGAEANCTKPLCCRVFEGQEDNPITERAQPNGNFHCDSPAVLADSMLDAINAIGPKFVIFTGDVVDGNFNWNGNQSGVENEFKDFDNQLLAKISSPVFPALGNHDSRPVNAFARTTSMATNNSQFVFDIQGAGWETWIGENASQQVIHHSGSYSSLVPGTNLRILSVNTQYWYKQNFWLYDSDEFQPDPNGMLGFIVEQLQEAEEAGQLVWVIGHIPLGKEDLVEDQSNYYDQILQRYKHTIAGHFFGHSHKDQFEIAYSDYEHQIASNAISVASIGPALTPTSGNPAFKLYDVDPDTFALMNVHVVYANLSDPAFQIQPTWKELYNTRDLYGPLVELPLEEELTPAFWHNLTEVFQTNDTAFQIFNELLGRTFPGTIGPCDEQCKETTICDMRAFRSENNCDTPSPGVPFRKRQVASTGSMLHDFEACEGFGIASVFRSLYERVL